MGFRAVFMFGARPDAKDSTKTIANLGQGGLSLPDRSYYLNTDAKSVETRQRFVEHMAKMFQLAGDSPEAAAAKAKLVLDFETLLAKDSLDRVAHARSEQDVSHHDAQRTAGADAQLRLECLLQVDERAGV